MPRPERPVDPSAGPVQQFAADLRKLRGEAGNPPYRDMAEQVHISRASLSAAASGHRLPTWEVTNGYVRACGGPADEWHARWLAVRAEVAPAAEPPVPVATRRRFALPVAIAAAVVVAGTLTAWGVTRDPAATDGTGREQLLPYRGSSVAAPTARFAGSGSEAVRDNADPKKSGCADHPDTLQELDRVQINTLNENLLGVAVLRHAPDCHASWGRFEPSDRLKFLSGPVRVTITAHRPATGTMGTAFSAAFDGQPVFGNILLDTAGCVEITVRVDAPDGGGEATTHCKGQ
jgi:hypothetical protein